MRPRASFLPVVNSKLLQPSAIERTSCFPKKWFHRSGISFAAPIAWCNLESLWDVSDPSDAMGFRSHVLWNFHPKFEKRPSHQRLTKNQRRVSSLGLGCGGGRWKTSLWSDPFLDLLKNYRSVALKTWLAMNFTRLWARLFATRKAFSLLEILLQISVLSLKIFVENTDWNRLDFSRRNPVAKLYWA